jgi:hypothetical protein
MMLSRTLALGTLALGHFLLVGLVQTPPSPPANDDPLVELNKTFRAAYARHRQAALQSTRPILLVDNDRLTLLTTGRRLEAAVPTPRYDEIKAVSHVPLAIYVLLVDQPEGPLPEALQADLRQLRRQIPPARASLASRGFEPASRKLHEQILDSALTFLDQVLAGGAVKAGEVRAFARRLGPLVMESAAEAAQLRIDAYHGQMKRWRGELSKEEWGQLQVVVIGSQMPRRNNLAVQYFARLLGLKGEGPRLTYAEALWEEPQALRLLGTRLVDTGIGQAFFDDPDYMHRDLLGYPATDYLRKLDFREINP